MEPINLRSDTQTLPTEEMFEAIRKAPLGDDTSDEDPTVQKLEKMAAQIMGKEAALLVISGTMGNLVSLMTHGHAGDEVLLDRESHIFYYECGSLAGIAGLMPMPLDSEKGMLDPGRLQEAIRPKNMHHPIPRVLCLENTHNRSGGRVIPLELHRSLCAVAKEYGLAVHLDGARIFNAAIREGVEARAFAEDVDSLMFCLSKGLSCPLGSIVVGSRSFIERADWARKRVGGGMRQAGVIAAAGIVALESMIDRLADDHRHARLLAEGLLEIPGLAVDLETVESNMVLVDHSGTNLPHDGFMETLGKAGVLASSRPPHHVRFVTNRHHDRDTIAEALVRIRSALA
jgi:threonine aldolase